MTSNNTNQAPDWLEDDNIEPEPTSIDSIVIRRDDDEPMAMLERLKKEAKLAPEKVRCYNQILVASTSPDDWIQFGDKMRLTSVGAEKVSRHFSIQLTNWTHRLEESSDEIGPIKTYVYECDAILGGRQLHSIGQCSTRDKFLCKSGGTWKAFEEIDMTHLRTAAYHRCENNAIRALLGIRSLHRSEWEQIFKGMGADTKTAGKATFGEGTKGGTSKEDSEKQRELVQMLIDLATDNKVIEFDESQGEAVLTESPVFDPNESAQYSLKQLTTFVGKDGNKVDGVDKSSLLKGKRLNVTLGKLKKMIGE